MSGEPALKKMRLLAPSQTSEPLQPQRHCPGAVQWKRCKLLPPDDQPAHLQPQRHRPEARFGFPTAGRVPEAAEYENNNLPEFGGDTRQRSLTWSQGSRGGSSGGSSGGHVSNQSPEMMDM